MKRSLFFIIVALLTVSSVFAGFDFTLVGDDTLYSEAKADPYSYTTHLYVSFIPEEDDCAYMIRALVQDENKLFYKDFQTKEKLQDMTERNQNLSMKIAETTSLLRFDIGDYLSTELNLNAFFNSLFVKGGGADVLGFDGSYFIGGTVKLNGIAALRVGVRHFSSHYGDEVLEDFYKTNNFDGQNSTISFDGKEYKFVGLSEYVRDNLIAVSIQSDFSDNVQLYADFEAPLYTSWLRPFIHSPFNHKTAGYDGDNGFKSLARGEGVDYEGNAQLNTVLEQEQALRDSSYQALRVSFGAEFKVNFLLGTLFAGANVTGHQDGKTLHNLGTYSSENPWDWEYTAGGGIELVNVLFGKNISAEVYWHYGRPSVCQYFYKNSFSSVSVGFGIR